MPSLIDPVSGLTITNLGDFTRLLMPDVTHGELLGSLEPMILSASGWRKVFAPSGTEEDASEEVNTIDLYLFSVMARAWFTFLSQKLQKPLEQLTVALALDTRPTGRLLADSMNRTATSLGVHIRYLFIASAPEAMAYARCEPDVDGFMYISASHNPIGHNGVKFGYNNGGVIPGADARELIELFKALVKDPGIISITKEDLSRCNIDDLKRIYGQVMSNKVRSLAHYTNFTRIVLSAHEEGDKQHFYFKRIKEAVATRPLGIVAELNGSARTLTIDRKFLEFLGIKVRVINGWPGKIVHRIVPEGQSLEQCCYELETAHLEDPAFTLGYVPDCDGDRGNLVYYHGESSQAKIIQAQDVFALSVLAEIADQVWQGIIQYDPQGKARMRMAVVVNDPTSTRIDDIAGYFDVRVFRAEVGEANVVQLAHSLRKNGYIVRILGEGSNGGNITHPAEVRDPLATLGGLIKLLSLRDGEKGPGLFHRYCDRAGLPYNNDFTIQDILDALPPWTSTSAYEDRAIMPILTQDHGILKARYEAFFVQAWEEQKSSLGERLGVVSYEVYNYEGIEEKKGMGREARSGKERGGFKILLKDSLGRTRGFLWMRGSGTEPVFRVMVEVAGRDEALEAWLLDWHRSIISLADDTSLKVPQL